MDIAFIAAPAKAEGPAAAVAAMAFEEGLSDEAAALDGAMGGAVARAGKRFTGAAGASLAFLAPTGLPAGLAMIVGAGKRTELDRLAFERFGGEALSLAARQNMADLVLSLPSASPEEAAHAALGARLAAYRFHKYRRQPREAEAMPVVRLAVAVADPEAARAAFAPLAGLADGMELARDLVSEPANVLHPEAFAERMRALARPGLEVEIVGEAALRDLGAGALLGVGLGSPRETCIAVLHWRGDPDPAAPPIAFVGKGVTFDTGGISIKPAAGLEEMKADMGGSAAIAGAIVALAGRKARVNAVGVLCIVENAVDGEAMRPGDIVTAMSGRTIEVINTDAEGRLALADGLCFCRDRFKPRVMVDVATLTGAVIVALGARYGGLYTEDDALAAALIEAGEAEGELLWRLPMPESYDRHIESLAADVKNVAVGIGRTGGASIAARFLKPFAGDTTWAHLDISGPAWPTETAAPTSPAGATGYGVRLLHRFASRYEGAPA